MIKITYNGITDTISGWAARTEIPITTIRSRFEYGWTPHRILTQPVRKHRSTERKHDLTPRPVTMESEMSDNCFGPNNDAEKIVFEREARIVDLEIQTKALTAERDALAAVLEGAEYLIDAKFIKHFGVKGGRLVGQEVAKETKRIIAERDALVEKLAKAEALLAAHHAWAAGEPSQPPVTGRDKTTLAAIKETPHD